jgi:hypothetical protein
MRRCILQLLTWALCLSIGAAQACACGESRRRGAPDKTDSHACCTSDPSPKPPERCPDCDLLVVATPKLADALSAGAFAPALTSVLESHSLVLMTARAAYRVADDVLLPPLLRDLHHLGTQLLE